MQMKQEIHMPMKLWIQEGIWKTQLNTDSPSPKIKPRKILCESSVARFPANKGVVINYDLEGNGSFSENFQKDFKPRSILQIKIETPSRF